MENRVEMLRNCIDAQVAGKGRGKLWFLERHMFAVSNFAAMLAVKRGLEPEIATMIGLLHDMHSLLAGDAANHAELGARKARELLAGLGTVDAAELETICGAIANHSNKHTVHDAYSELAKDADVLSHYFSNTTLGVAQGEQARLGRLLAEFGLGKMPA